MIYLFHPEAPQILGISYDNVVKVSKDSVLVILIKDLATAKG